MVLPPIAYWRIRQRYYNLKGNICKDCGKQFFPPVHVCTRCGSRNLEDATMPERGRLITFTITHQLGSSYKRYRPLVFGIVELDNGVRVLGQLVDFAEDQLKEGARVRLVIRRLRENGHDGIIYYGFKFAPEEL